MDAIRTDDPRENRGAARSALENVCLVVSAGGALAALVGSFVLLPYRVSALEHEQADAKVRAAAKETARAADHELLVRIDERVAAISIAIKLGQKEIISPIP